MVHVQVRSLSDGKKEIQPNLQGIPILGHDIGLAFPDVSLRPPAGGFSIFREASDEDHHAHFLMRIDSIWTKPVVSVGLNPSSSTIEDSFSSYRPI